MYIVFAQETFRPENLLIRSVLIIKTWNKGVREKSRFSNIRVLGIAVRFLCIQLCFYALLHLLVGRPVLREGCVRALHVLVLVHERTSE
jgi:hypothetical protein